MLLHLFYNPYENTGLDNVIRRLIRQSVMTLLASPKIPQSNKLRLAILYALRYQKAPANQISQVVDALIMNGVSADKARLVYVMLNFAGADIRQDDLFANESFFSKGKSALKGLKVGDRRSQWMVER